MLYVLQLYMLQLYVLQQLYVLRTAGIFAIHAAGICAAAVICGCQPWTFGLSGQLKCQLPLPLSLSVSGSSFTNVDICIWATLCIKS